MADQENYVVCGQSIAKLLPTAELRFTRPVGTTTAPDRLQQKWVASARMADGGMWEEYRWRDVPLVIVNG